MPVHEAAVAEIDLAEINLLDLDRFASHGAPHEWFRILRQRLPIAHHAEPNGPGFYVFSRYEDVVAIGKAHGRFSSDAARGAIFGLEEPTADRAELMQAAGNGQNMITMDPPAHARYRRLVNRGFTAKMINRMQDGIRGRVSLLVTEALGKGQLDFVEDLAARLPLDIIADLMGIPVSDRSMVFHWSNQLMGQDEPEFNSSPQDVLHASRQFFSYAQELARQARGRPRDDVISKLVGADLDGDKLSDSDFNRFFELLVIAGNETTRNAITHGMLALIDHPEQYAQLHADPALCMNATEEIIRWASPVMYFRRNVAVDHEYNGVQFRSGDKVSIWYVSANRDETIFDEPDRFDITRASNPHVAFGGGGPHYCLGAHLARLELTTFFAELTKRVRQVELLGPPQFMRSNFVNGIKHLPVLLKPR